MKKERPILFNGEMVRAILDGRKTQTRRIVKPQPTRFNGLSGGKWIGWPIDDNGALVQSPFGGPGDHLWVRETFAIETPGETLETEPHKPLGPVRRTGGGDFEDTSWFECPRYRASEPETLLIIRDDVESDEDAMRWTPSIHMPRWASRITLEVTDIRVERLQDISSKDALAEGVEYDVSKERGWPLSRFEMLWDSVYGNWKENPWVWVVEFRRLEAQEKAA